MVEKLKEDQPAPSVCQQERLLLALSQIIHAHPVGPASGMKCLPLTKRLPAPAPILLSSGLFSVFPNILETSHTAFSSLMSIYVSPLPL